MLATEAARSAPAKAKSETTLNGAVIPRGAAMRSDAHSRNTLASPLLAS